MCKKVLVACAVRNRGWILPYFIKCILNIDYPKKCLGFLFILNNSTDDSKSILENLYNIHKNDYCSFKIIEKNYGELAEDTRIGSRTHIYPILADLRNYMVEEFLKSDCNYLFQIDSDILAKPNILKELLDLNALASSAVISNDYGRGIISNCMYIYGTRSTDIKHVNLNELPDVFECDLSGACALYKRELLEKGFKYKNGPMGEDVDFCFQLKETGVKFKRKKGLVYEHIMKPDMLEKFKEEI